MVEMKVDDLPVDCKIMLAGAAANFADKGSVMSMVAARWKGALVLAPTDFISIGATSAGQAKERWATLMTMLAKCGADWVALICEAWTAVVSTDEIDTKDRKAVAEFMKKASAIDLSTHPDRIEIVIVLFCSPTAEWSVKAEILRPARLAPSLGPWEVMQDGNMEATGRFMGIWGKASECEKRDLERNLAAAGLTVGVN